MARAEDTEVIDKFEAFYRDYYRNEIGQLAQKYPNEKRSLYVDWNDLYRFDPDLADDFIAQPDQMLEYAEEALRLYDLPVDVKLGQAHVRVQNLQRTTGIRDIRARHRGQLVEVTGIVRKATDVRPKVIEAAFECQRCGTLTRIPQTSGEFYEPHECQGCERQGPFDINFDQSEFVEAQQVRLSENPGNLDSDSQPQGIDIRVADDLTGQAISGNRVRVTGVVRLEQQGTNQDPVFDPHMMAGSIERLDDEQPIEHQSSPNAVTDLETYLDLASTAVSTLPDDAREEETKAKLVTPFVEALGWNKFNGTEVRLEYTESKTNQRPDYVLFGPDGPAVIVEAKQTGTSLESKESQLLDYLRVFGADRGVLTNGKKFHIFIQTGDRLPERPAELTLDELSDASILHQLRRDAVYK
jgi:replicative DNA helicase Mcm